jgi:hypothetical protein
VRGKDFGATSFLANTQYIVFWDNFSHSLGDALRRSIGLVTCLQNKPNIHDDC